MQRLPCSRTEPMSTQLSCRVQVIVSLRDPTALQNISGPALYRKRDRIGKIIISVHETIVGKYRHRNKHRTHGFPRRACPFHDRHGTEAQVQRLLVQRSFGVGRTRGIRVGQDLRRTDIPWNGTSNTDRSHATHRPKNDGPPHSAK